MYSNLNAPKIQTNRLLIRPVSIYDANDYYNFCSDQRVCKYLTFNPYTSIFQAKRAIENMIRASLIGSDVNYSIIYRNENKIIGSISLTFNKYENSADVGYILSYDYWNQHFMSEALKEVIDISFNYYNLDFLTASYISENTSSEALLKKFNFKVIEKIEGGFIKNNIKYDLIKCVLYR